MVLMSDRREDHETTPGQSERPAPEPVTDTTGLSRGLSSTDSASDDTTVIAPVPRAYSEYDPPTLSFQAVPDDHPVRQGYAPRTEPEPIPPTHDEYGPIIEDPDAPSEGVNVPTGLVYGIAAVAAVVVVVSLVTIVLSSPDETTPEAANSPGQAQGLDPAEESAPEPEPEPDVGADLGSGSDSDDQDPSVSVAPQGQVDLRQEGEFTWYGDRVSQLAAGHSPIIATPDETFYFNANDGVTVDRVLDSVDSRVPSGEIGDMVVFAYGTTEPVSPQQLEHLINSLGPERGLILVGPGTLNHGDAPWVDQVNDMYRDVADAVPSPRIQHVDWSRTLASRPDLVTRDYVLTEAGTRVWADQINAAIANYYDAP